jgi:hypothetical protein
MKVFTEAEADRVCGAFDFLDILTSGRKMGKTTAFDSMVALFIEKWAYGPEEEDLVLMENSLVIEEAPGQTKTVKLCMKDTGVVSKMSSVSRLVALPAAIAT